MNFNQIKWLISKIICQITPLTLKRIIPWLEVKSWTRGLQRASEDFQRLKRKTRINLTLTRIWRMKLKIGLFKNRNKQERMWYTEKAKKSRSRKRVKRSVGKCPVKEGIEDKRAKISQPKEKERERINKTWNMSKMKKATHLIESGVNCKRNKKGRAREMKIVLHIMRISHSLVRDRVWNRPGNSIQQYSIKIHQKK